MDDQMARIELEVANGWSLRPDAVPENLTAEERGRFALVADGSRGTSRTDAADPDEWNGKWRGVVPGGAAWDDSKIDGDTSDSDISDGDTSANDDGSATAEQFIREEVRSPWAVWTTGALLSAAECAAWIERAEALDLETGDLTRGFGSGDLLQTGIYGLLSPANTQIRVKPGHAGLLGAVVGPVVDGVLALLPDRLLSTLAAPVDGVLDGALQAAGLELGAGELTLTGHHCEVVQLVQ